jgi:hypothetical protein
MMGEKTRSDKGKPRVTAIRPPKRITLYLAGHGAEAKIANALEADVKRKKRDDPDANEQDVLKDWLCDHLGLERE